MFHSRLNDSEKHKEGEFRLFDLLGLLKIMAFVIAYSGII